MSDAEKGRRICIYTFMSDISDELSKRVGRMRCESQSLAKNMLRVKSIPLKGKVSVMQAYVLSRGTFQCGTWPALNSVQYKRFHSCILKIYRDASGNYFKCGSHECEPCEPSGFSVMNIINDDDIVWNKNGTRIPEWNFNGTEIHQMEQEWNNTP